jgi:hypothetical protein
MWDAPLRLRGGSLVNRYHKRLVPVEKCYALAAWMITMAATAGHRQPPQATAFCQDDLNAQS